MSVEPWYGRVAAQGHDPGARASDVAEQQLEQRGAADDLRAVRVLRPGHRVGERARLVGAEAFRSVSATFRKVSFGQPVTRSTRSGV